MPRFFYNENGELQFKSKYSHDGAYSIYDIYGENYKTHRMIKFKKGSSYEDYGVSAKYLVAHMVFYDFLLLVLEDLVEGGMFIFPGKSEANISLKPYDATAIEKFLDLGLLSKRDVDKANKKIPYFEFDFGPRFKRKPKRVQVPRWLREKAIQNAINGKVNWIYYDKKK